jgi:type IV secretory pathway protease TraF
VHPLPRLTYNPSDSVAVGWYRVDPPTIAARSPRPLSVGSIVLVPLPAEAAALAAQRGYLPTRVPLLKRVGAVAPQEVCIADGSVRIDGVPSAAVLPADRWGRPLPSWQQCRRLRPASCSCSA